MKKLLLMPLFLLASFLLMANDDDSTKAQQDEIDRFVDSVNKSFKYETGRVKLSNGVAELNVPAGFKFLDAAQSKHVVTELWGNPPDSTILGMVLPENAGPMGDHVYAFVVTYDAMGYVKDEDADEIDYDEMLKNIKKEEPADNAERKKQGYGAIHMIGWAQKPFYDKQNKVLHWAKELQFEGNDYHTLNYEVRILGRKGILSMNAVGGMEELALVKKDVEKVLHIAEFTEGNKYKDFDPKVDEVAAWTIGGLVAGKLLAKAGLFVLLAKFWKLILLGVVALGGVLFKVFKRKKTEEVAVETVQAPPPADNTNA